MTDAATDSEQARHEERLAEDPGHDRSPCACCCTDCTDDHGPGMGWQVLMAALKARRKELRLSQRNLAKILGTTNPVISWWENSKRWPRPDTVRRWAAALGVRIQVTYRLVPLASEDPEPEAPDGATEA